MSKPRLAACKPPRIESKTCTSVARCATQTNPRKRVDEAASGGL